MVVAVGLAGCCEEKKNEDVGEDPAAESVACEGGCCSLSGGESDPFAPDYVRNPEIDPGRGQKVRETVRLRVETFAVEAREAMARLDEVSGAADVAEWRDELAKDGDVELVVSLAHGGDVGGKLSAEGITERIYPTEYEAPGLGSMIEPAGEAAEPPTPAEEWFAALTSQAFPTAFETRNTGWSVEAEIQPVPAEPGTLDLSLSVEEVAQVGTENYGPEELVVKMPVFTTHRVGGLLRVKIGEWQLLSVQEPPRGTEDGRPEQRWVTFIRLDPAR